MSEIVEVQYRKPFAEALTVKLTRDEALDLLSTYESMWRKNNFYWRLDGKPSKVYADIHQAVFGEPHKLAPRKNAFTEAFSVF